METRIPSNELVRLDERKSDGRWSPAVVKAFRKRMQSIRSAVDERDIRNMKSNHLEKLKGDRSHQHSVMLNDQWRLILEFKDEPTGRVVMVVAIEDYH